MRPGQTERRDRTVHAWTPQMDVVRYDRSGKWYLEPNDRSLPRQQVSIADAVKYAMWGWYETNGSVEFGRPGGNTFDRLVRKAVSERTSDTGGDDAYA